jgi:hypothetical protein
VEVDGFAGSERVFGSIQTAAIGIDDCLSLQRDSLRNQLSKPWTKLEPPARYEYLFDFTVTDQSRRGPIQRLRHGRAEVPVIGQRSNARALPSPAQARPLTLDAVYRRILLSD